MFFFIAKHFNYNFLNFPHDSNLDLSHTYSLLFLKVEHSIT